MSRYLADRAIGAVLTLVLASVLAFGLFQLLPGGAAEAQLGLYVTPEALAAARSRLGLDQPPHLQYLRWLGGVVTGDLGRSVVANEPVADLIGSKLPPTLTLAVISLLLAVPTALGIGVLAAARPGSRTDRFMSLVTMSGISMPNFWLALILIALFSITLRWLPTAGYVPLTEDPVQSLRYMVLPSLTQATALAAVLARITRGSMVEVMTSDYIRTARAKGFGERYILVRHALRNALIPVVSVAGLQVGTLIGGAIITESLFGIPGMGNLLVNSIYRRDHPTVQALMLASATAFVTINLLVDVSYSVINPRIQRS